VTSHGFGPVRFLRMTALRTRLGFCLTPISDEHADELLSRPGLTLRVTDSYPGYPCRRCLRDAEVGDAVALVSYNPFDGTSEYSQSGPIFLHADGCRSYQPNDRVPAQLLRRQLSVRAFDEAHAMVEARVVLGTCLDAIARELLEDERVAYLHVHNAAAGCWATRIDRA
jgi:hypothetical protein